MGENKSEMRNFLDVMQGGGPRNRAGKSQYLDLIRQLHEGIDQREAKRPEPKVPFGLPLSAGLLISRHFDLTRFIMEHADLLTDSRTIDGDAVILIGRRIAEGFDLSGYVKPKKRAGKVMTEVRTILEATNRDLPKSLLVEGLRGDDPHWLMNATEEMRQRCNEDGEACQEVVNELARGYADTEGGHHEAFEFARDALEKRAWELGLKDGTASVSADRRKDREPLEVMLPITMEQRVDRKKKSPAGRLAEAVTPAELQAVQKILQSPNGDKYAEVGAKAAGNSMFAREMIQFLHPSVDIEKFAQQKSSRFQSMGRDPVDTATRHREAAVKAILAAAQQAQANAQQAGVSQADQSDLDPGRVTGAAAPRAAVASQMAPIANRDDWKRDAAPGSAQPTRQGDREAMASTSKPVQNPATVAKQGKTRSEFAAAFKDARSKGLLKFDFKGKAYHTRLDTENDQQWRGAMAKAAKAAGGTATPPASPNAEPTASAAAPASPVAADTAATPERQKDAGEVKQMLSDPKASEALQQMLQKLNQEGRPETVNSGYRNPRPPIIESSYSERARRIILEAGYTEQQIRDILASPSHPDGDRLRQMFRQTLQSVKTGKADMTGVPKAKDAQPDPSVTKTTEPEKPAAAKPQDAKTDPDAVEEEIAKLEDRNAYYKETADQARERYRNSRMSGATTEQIARWLIRNGFSNRDVQWAPVPKRISRSLYTMMAKGGMVKDDWVAEETAGIEKDAEAKASAEDAKNPNRIKPNQNPVKTANSFKVPEDFADQSDAARKLYVKARTEDELSDEQVAKSLFDNGVHKPGRYSGGTATARCLYLMMLNASLIPLKYRYKDDGFDPRRG